MYKILFIDEQKEAQDDFLDYVDFSTASDIKAKVMFPFNNIDETIDAILSENPDAIISDFELNELKTDIKYTVPYNGVELVTKFLSIKHGFPCFIMTAFDNKAVHSSEDVNIVYVKNILHKQSNQEEKATITFLDRVKEQIRHYRTKISDAETELMQLIELRKIGKATFEDETRLIELDTFLESTIDNRALIPSEYKESSNQKRLSDLLGSVNELVKKLEENK
jgi:DNA-binding NarL/FixJ family response regulator